MNLFDQILPFFKAAHNEYFHLHDVKGKKNDPSTQSLHTVQQSAYDDRRTPVFILTFLKNNPTQEYHAAGFDMFLNLIIT